MSKESELKKSFKERYDTFMKNMRIATNIPNKQYYLGYVEAVIACYADVFNMDYSQAENELFYGFKEVVTK